jgi:hypothetical protein
MELVAVGLAVYSLGAYVVSLAGFGDRLACCERPWETRLACAATAAAPVVVPAVAFVVVAGRALCVHRRARAWRLGTGKPRSKN